MEYRAIAMLDEHRVMTVATLRPDGWPQATMVSYANDGLLLYFLVSRASQKFANIRRDPRVSIAVGRPFDTPAQIRGLSMAAMASEVTSPEQREKAYALLVARHPAFREMPRPDFASAVMLRAACRVASLVDYSLGFGHSDEFTVAGDVVQMRAARPDDWGLAANPERARAGPA